MFSICQYISSSINTCVFVVNCEWDNFSDWTSCSKSCGGGQQTRTRAVRILHQNGGTPCTGDETETQLCNTDLCPCMHNTV